VPVTKEVDTRSTASERNKVQELAANKITDEEKEGEVSDEEKEGEVSDEEKEGEFDDDKGYWRY
jgi:hypothetical protein